MASARLLYSLLPFLLVVLLLQTNQISSAQHDDNYECDLVIGQQKLPRETCFPLAEGAKAAYLMRYFLPSEHNEVIVYVDRIKKALWDAGYKIMSLIIEKQLPLIIPFNEFNRDKITLYNNNSITLFVPSDEAVSIRAWMRLEYQVAISKVGKEDFYSGRLSRGSKLLTLDIDHKISVTEDLKNGYASINDVKIKEWNIYNDGHVLVHGVENFFHPLFPSGFPWSEHFVDDHVDFD